MRLLQRKPFRVLALSALALGIIDVAVVTTSSGPASTTAQHVSSQQVMPYDETAELNRLKARASRSRPVRVTISPSPQVHPQAVHHRKRIHVSYNATGITPVWIALVQCEAGGRWRYGAPDVGIDPGYRFEGGPNFTHGTWVAYGGREFAEHAYDATPTQQIIVARRVLAGQGVGAWPQCGPRVGLRRGM